MSDTTTTEINTQLARLEGGELAPDDVLLLRGRVEEMIRVAKGWLEQVDRGMVELIKRDGPLTIPMPGGEIKYWVGHDKRTKCIDPRKTLMFLMEGDINDALDCLSSNAIKYGSFRKLLAAQGREAEYEQHFSTEVIDKLESGEALPKKLLKLDSRYLR